MNSKELIFFSLVFIIMLLSVLLSKSLDVKYYIPATIVMVMGFTLVLMGVYWKGNLCEEPENFTFEVTPAKLCQGGEYMHQSNPRREKCENLLSTPEGRKEYAEYDCLNPALIGRPVHFEYTPLSNDMWQNERCEGSLVGTPRVL
jgi:hypothetical protein